MPISTQLVLESPSHRASRGFSAASRLQLPARTIRMGADLPLLRDTGRAKTPNLCHPYANYASVQQRRERDQ